MKDKQQIIIDHFRNGKSKSRIAKDLGISRTTVKKYIRDYQKEMARQEKTDLLQEFTIPPEGIISAPRYDSTGRKKRSMTKEMKLLVDKCMEENEKKRSKGMHKQIMLKIDIHEYLEDLGHKASYSTVRRYISAKEVKKREVFIRQHYEPGQAVEFDWGEVKLNIGGVRKNMMLAIFTMCQSNHRWARLYHRQDMSSFLDSHSKYFASTGAVPGQVVYDNMRVAVRKFTIKNSEKEATEGLLKISCYYQFDYRFCNAGKGNEKGHVEKSVEYIRRKSFSRIDGFNSLEEANLHLSNTCERLNKKPLTGNTISIQETFETELLYMRPSPSPYDSAEFRRLKVDKYSTINLDTNHYSVLEGSVGKSVNVKIYPDKIFVYRSDNQCIAKHARHHSRHNFYLKMEHYLKTLRTKPGALLGSLTLHQADQNLRSIFEEHFKNKARDFVDILKYVKEHKFSIGELKQSIDKCMKYCPHHPLNVDMMKIILLKRDIIENPRPNDGRDSQTQSGIISQHCEEQLQDVQSLFSPI